MMRIALRRVNKAASDLLISVWSVKRLICNFLHVHSTLLHKTFLSLSLWPKLKMQFPSFFVCATLRIHFFQVLKKNLSTWVGQQTEEMHCNATNLTMHARIISSSIFKAICISHLATTQQFSSAKHTRANFNRIHFHFLLCHSKMFHKTSCLPHYEWCKAWCGCLCVEISSLPCFNIFSSSHRHRFLSRSILSLAMC